MGSNGRNLPTQSASEVAVHHHCEQLAVELGTCSRKYSLKIHLIKH